MRGTNAGAKTAVIILSVLNVLAAGALVFLVLAPKLAGAAESGGPAEVQTERQETKEEQTRGRSLRLEGLSYHVEAAPEPVTGQQPGGAGAAAPGGEGFSAGPSDYGMGPSGYPAGGTGSEYILPESSTRYYSREELEALTDEELYYARNEIYARLGRKFNTDELQQYFSAKSWYVPRYEPAEFDRMGESAFNPYELANINLIKSIEETR